MTDNGFIQIRRNLLQELIDTEPCWFDHHGGCQSHGYLDLKPGEICPQQQLKGLLEDTK